ncbi:MAG: nucleotidyltransferase family protein [Methylococcales bacterium]
MNEAIILAGGLGTRLYPLTRTVPKPMMPIAEKPFLEYLLERLSKHGFSRIALSVGYLGEQIESHFGPEWHGLELFYAHEDAPLGTGGAIALTLPYLRSDYTLVLNGDTFCALDWQAMGRFHENKSADLTIALKPMYNFQRYGNVKVCEERVISFEEKQFVSSGQMNTGVYILNRDLFVHFKMPEVFSFEMDFLQCRLHEVVAAAFMTDGYFIDIGVPADYDRARSELPEMI